MNCPRILNIGRNPNPRNESLNIDKKTGHGVDVVWDMEIPLAGMDERIFSATRFGTVHLRPGMADRIIARNVLPEVRDLAGFLSNCLWLLEPGGVLEVETPYDLSDGAWESPFTVRAFNERTWRWIGDHSESLGWTNEKLAPERIEFVLSPVGARMKERGVDTAEILATPRAVASLKARLKKIRTDGAPVASSSPTMPIALASGVYCIWVVTPPGNPHHHAFDEIALSLRSAFARLGFDAPVVFRPEDIRGRAVVLGGNFIPKIGLRELPRSLILFNLEQVQDRSPWITPAYIQLLKHFPVWDYSLQNIRALQGLGVVDIRHCRIGYVPELTRIAPAVEDIDVLFYGSMNERRQQILQAIRDRGMKVAGVFGVYGEKRDALIARAKIVLNLHFYEAQVFEVVRVSYLLANRKFVISEPGGDMELEAPFRDGLVFREAGEIVDCCQEWLRNAEGRKAVAERGFDIMRGRPQEELLRAALEKK